MDELLLKSIVDELSICMESNKNLGVRMNTLSSKVKNFSKDGVFLKFNTLHAEIKEMKEEIDQINSKQSFLNELLPVFENKMMTEIGIYSKNSAAYNSLSQSFDIRIQAIEHRVGRIEYDHKKSD